MPDQPTITMNEIIHAAVRRDLARAEAALRAFPDGDRQRAADLKRAWDFLSEMLHEHHVGEDENVWPYLRTLGEIDPELADVMESEHVEMAAAMARASAASSLTIRRSPLTSPNARAAELARSTRSLLSTTTAEEERTERTEAIPGGSLAGCCGARSREPRAWRAGPPDPAALVLIATPPP